MIRRPSRTALHSALSALSGGLRGVAMQRQQEEERTQTGLRNEREALRDALSLADIGATEAPETFAPGAPVPQTVPFGGKRYIVPTPAERQERASRAEAERARVAAEAKAKVEEAQREAANRRAFGAAQLAVPELVPQTAEYNPTVEYAELFGGRRTTGTTPRSLTPGQAIAEADKERLGFGYIAEFNDPQGATFTESERERFWRAFNILQKNNPTGASDARLAYSAFQTIRAGTQQSATIDAAERAAAEERARAERARRSGNRSAPPGVPAVQPNTAAARPAAPATAPTAPVAARPAATPSAPVTAPASAPAVSPDTAPRTQWRPADYDAALDALGPDAGDAEVNAWLVQNRPLTRVP